MIADSRAYYLQNDKPSKRRIIVDESEVIPLYDVPHLVKGLRNNLLEKDLIWHNQDTAYVAKWEDIVNAYYIDSSEDIRCIPKITECHVIKGKLKKMKVSCATQVFSHSMAAAISIMARNEESDITGQHKMDKRAHQTAKVIKFLDNVFDSLNGGTYTGHPGKPLKGAVRKNSDHVTFWREAICSMKNMYFQKEGTRQKIIPPSLKNFIITLEGFIDVTTVLLTKIPYFFTRSFNQDPLENYFGQIRQHRGRHTNPTCAQFEDSYRALLIRSISGTHSAAANCEETFETSLFQLQDVVSRGRGLESEPYVFEENPCIYTAISTISDVKLVRPLCKSVLGYISGFIAKKVLMKFKCDFCRIHIVKASPTNSDFADLISAKEFNRSKNMLTYCNDVFVECIYKAYNIAKIIVSNYIIDRNIKKTLCTYIQQFVHFSFLCNHKEELINYIINFVIDICIFTFCKCVNNIILGKNSNVTDKSCALYKQAQIIHQKRNKMKK